MKTIIPEMVYQGETHECGLACIAMLAETQHLNVTLPELRETFPASEHGTSLVTLCSILEALSVPVYPVAFSYRYRHFFTMAQAITSCLPTGEGIMFVS